MALDWLPILPPPIAEPPSAVPAVSPVSSAPCRAPGGWTTFAIVRDDGRWSFQVITPQLEDDTEYEFRVVPRDAMKNEGTPLDLGIERVVRWPEPMLVEASWDPDTGRFTFDEA